MDDGREIADLTDGWIDFYFGTGDPQLSRLEPNRFFRNNGDGTFSDLTTVVGWARPGNKGHGACFIDIDEDGDLDAYTQLGGHYPGDHAENAFYRNLKGNQKTGSKSTGNKNQQVRCGVTIVVKAGNLTVHRVRSEGFGELSPRAFRVGRSHESRFR
jgi:hypothetical protein